MITRPSDADALNILNNFNRVHNQWFGVRSFAGLSSSRDYYVHDMGEGSLYITRALFTDGSYEDILKENRIPMAWRDAGANTHLSLRRTWQVKDDAGTNIYGTDVVSSAQKSFLIQRGELRGIGWRSAQHVLRLGDHASGEDQCAQSTQPGDVALNCRAMPASRQREAKNYANRSTGVHHGAGLIGLESYFIMNRAATSLSDGFTRLPRQWASNLISDLLCRDVPAIRLSDVKPRHVDTRPEQQISYRQSASCMRCHATLDPMASTVRNFYVAISPNFFGNAAHIHHVFKANARPANHSPAYNDIFDLKAAYKNFYELPPIGEFYFRSYDGTLINQRLANYQDLAAALLATDDLYVCAARKYFEHFTGIRADLRDLDPLEAPLEDDDRVYRDIVVELGLRFKRHKNLRTLVKSILDTDVYRKASLRRMYEGGRYE